MTYKGYLTIALLACLSACQVAPHNQLPNIIIILTDDLGYADLSSYGSDYLETPYIDSLVMGGMRFSNYHTNSPVCSPTRAALLSGRYPDLIGMPGVVRTDTADSWGYLAPDAVLLPQVLKTRYGYQTAHIGKWNLGLSTPNLPNERGFTHFKGFLGDKMDDYYHHLRQGSNYLRYNEHTITPDTTHATDLFSQWASDYIASRQGQPEPFFLYLAYNAPHRPIQVPTEWVKRYKQRFPNIPEPRATYCAMVEHLDAGIGQVIAALRQAQLADNTLIIFSSDNGGNLNEGANNGNVRGSKATLYEGALRVPLAVWFPQRIAARSQSNALLMTMDIAPTLYDLLDQWYLSAPATNDRANKPAPKSDGRSFLPLLTDNMVKDERDLFWIWRESGEQFGASGSIEAYRIGNFKLLRPNPTEPLELYNLSNDPQEQCNLAASDTATFRRMTNLLRARVKEAYKIPCKPPHAVQ